MCLSYEESWNVDQKPWWIGAELYRWLAGRNCASKLAGFRSILLALPNANLETSTTRPFFPSWSFCHALYTRNWQFNQFLWRCFCALKSKSSTFWMALNELSISPAAHLGVDYKQHTTIFYNGIRISSPSQWRINKECAQVEAPWQDLGIFL